MEWLFRQKTWSDKDPAAQESQEAEAPAKGLQSLGARAGGWGTGEQDAELGRGLLVRALKCQAEDVWLYSARSRESVGAGRRPVSEAAGWVPFLSRGSLQKQLAPDLSQPASPGQSGEESHVLWAA